MAAQLEIIPPGGVTIADEAFLAQAEGQIRAYGKQVVSGIVAIGQKLAEVKEQVPGRYNAFVSERLGWSLMQATRFVNAYQMLRLNNLLSDAADLTIDASSLYLIAAPSTPAEAREAVLVKAATPEGISREEAARMVAARHSVARANTPTPFAPNGVGRPDRCPQSLLIGAATRPSRSPLKYANKLMLNLGGDTAPKDDSFPPK